MDAGVLALHDGCAGDGVLTISSLEGSYNGEGWRSTPEQPFRLRSIGTWGVNGQEGSDPASADCSAHYFDVRGKARSGYVPGRVLGVPAPHEADADDADTDPLGTHASWAATKV